MVQSAIQGVNSDKAIAGAVKLTELSRDFAQVPFLAGTLEAAWKEFYAQANDPQIAEQAQKIVKAREAEKKDNQSEAIATYQLVVTTYPNTQAVKLSQLRIDRLQPMPAASERLWKSKNGKFSITATLLSFDGTTARLKASDGRTIDVPMQSLSGEDQKFLAATKK